MPKRLNIHTLKNAVAMVTEARQAMVNFSRRIKGEWQAKHA
jgi:hypothetical protein